MRGLRGLSESGIKVEFLSVVPSGHQREVGNRNLSHLQIRVDLMGVSVLAVALHFVLSCRSLCFFCEVGMSTFPIFQIWA